MHNCIQTENLKPGMVIVQVTKQNGPLKIRKAGLVTSVDMVQGLLEMGIQEVQIDPSQTVEFETSVPVAQSSATMQLLQSNNSTQAKTDHQLHDQFNRSLFLPSVQDIPSQWQFYTKRVATMVVLVVAGVTLGFGAAYLPSVLALRSPIVVAEPEEDIPEPVSEPVAKSVEIANNSAKPSPMTQQQVVIQAVEQPVATEQEQANNQPASPARQTQDIQVSAVQDNATDKVLQQSPPENSEPLSPELVKRFEKVMQQMDREERYGAKKSESARAQHNTSSNTPIVDLSEFPILDEQGEPLSEQKVSEQGEFLAKQQALTQIANERTVQDVPRIDQLPEWLMAELPNMAFSAHMYASVPSERWVRVNGQNKHEGELIDNKVHIVYIAPQHVILNYAGHEFSMQAMTDW